MMKFLSLSSFVIFLSVLTFVYLYNANAISPKFSSQTLQDKTQDVNVYSHNNNNNNNRSIRLTIFNILNIPFYEDI
jgi:hypothetical protein